MKVYTLKTCDACRKATQWLREKGISFQEIPIRETPPSKEELRRALSYFNGDIRKLFNTSGKDYRALNLKDQLPTISADKAIALLTSNGNLIKRPFLISPNTVLVGFKAETWSDALV